MALTPDAWVTPQNVDELISLYHDNELGVTLTSSTTCASCVHIVPEFKPAGGSGALTIFVRDDKQLRDEILWFLDQGYRFARRSVTFTCSLWQLRLRDARQTLVECLLKRLPNPHEVEKVISEAGSALNLQVDRHLAGKMASNNIHTKLQTLGLGDDAAGRELEEKYGDLNRFYNATKHGLTDDNRRDEATLAGPSGREIAIDFFETVRRLFIWYYGKHCGGTPPWEELTPIDPGAYGVAYHWSAAHRWP